MSFYGDGAFYGDEESAGAFTTISVAAGTVFSIKQHDTAPAITDTLTDADGNAVDLSSASSVRFVMTRGGNTSASVDATGQVVSGPAGTVRYDWAVGDTATIGGYRAEWQVTWSDGRIQTFPAAGYRTVKVYNDLGG